MEKYENEDPLVSEEDIKLAVANLKKCFNDADGDIIAGILKLISLMEYSIGELSNECQETADLTLELNQIGYSNEESEEAIAGMFEYYSALANGSTPLQSSEISGIEFTTHTQQPEVDYNNITGGNLIESYYEKEKEIFFCHVANEYETENIFNKDDPGYDEKLAIKHMDKIMSAVAAAGESMASEFSVEILAGMEVIDIYNEGNNKEKIKSMLQDALQNEIYKF